MSFGFSIGDFLAVIERANKLRKVFVAAPSQFKALCDEVRSLSIVVRDVEVDISDANLSTEQETELTQIAESCRNVLIDIENLVSKYCEINKTRGAKRIWKRLAWVPDDVRDLQNRVCSNISILNAFNGTRTRDNMMKLVTYTTDAQHQAILDWLSSTTYALQQSEFISQRQPGTGEWLIQCAKFQTWIGSPNETLFCPGMPGAGKTILSSVVIDELISRYGNDSDIGYAYLYCNFQKDQIQTVSNMLAGILRQLTQSLTMMPEKLITFYEKHKVQGTRPTAEELSRALVSISGRFSRVFLVIDALDECQYHVMSQILEMMFNLQTTSTLNLLATSRYIPEIAAFFQDKPTQEISAARTDVIRYLSGSLSKLPSKLPSFVSRDPLLQEEITSGIADAVSGMFLLAKLYLNSLIGKKSRRALRIELKKMGTGPKASEWAYDCAYNDAMQRIMGQLPDQKDLAWEVLSWTTCARRPLTVTELRNALAVELDESEFYEDNLPDLEDIISVCAGLIAVSTDGSDDVVQLVHYTTQEYFERTWPRWFPQAHSTIAAICVTYISFDVFQRGFCLSDIEFESRLAKYPFFSYAAKYWGDHARAQSISQNLIMAFLQDSLKVDASVQALFARNGFSTLGGYSLLVPLGFTSLHLAAYFGLGQTLWPLIQSGVPYATKCSMGRTSLAWATFAGHVEPVKLLLGIGMSPIDYDHDGQSSMTLAASMGWVDVLELFLQQGVYPDSKDITGQTCLSIAADRGHEHVVRMLLSKGANPDVKDENGQTPLSWAASSGWVEIARLLLESSVELESNDLFGRTPLSWAAESGHTDMVNLLLKEGAQVNSKDAQGHTPLSWAAHHGHKRLLPLLQPRDGNQIMPAFISEDSMMHGMNEHSTFQFRCDLKRGKERVLNTNLTNFRIRNPDSSNGQTEFRCPLCPFGLKWTAHSINTFKQHVYSRHCARFLYQCCSKHRPFARLDNFREHLQRVHREKLTDTQLQNYRLEEPHPKTCPVCQASLSSWKAFIRCVSRHMGSQGSRAVSETDNGKE